MRNIVELSDFGLCGSCDALAGLPCRVHAGEAGRPLVGRDRERATIASALELAAAGHGGVVVISGEAGIGKSRLLDEGLRTARALGLHVVHGLADELDWDRPFGLLARVLDLASSSPDVRRRRAGELIEAGGAADKGGKSPSLRFRLEEDIVAMVEEFATANPTLLALEDLQWSDSQSLSTLARLSAVATSLPLAIVATRRGSPLTNALGLTLDRFAKVGAGFVDLAPLAPADAEAVAEDALAARLGLRLAVAVAAAGGNPLFVEEIVETLQRDGAILVEDGVAEIAAATPVSSLTPTALRRLAGLSAAAVDLTRLAAIIGQSFSADDLVAASTTPATDLLPSLDEIAAAGIFELGDRVRFRHDVLREAVYFDTPPTVRKALHLQVARSLAESAAPAVRVAAHMSLGADVGNAEAAQWMRAAARSPAQSPDARVELLERTLTICAEDDPERAALLAELAVALAWAARPADAERRVHEVFRATQDHGIRAEVRIALAQALILGARWAEAERCLLDVLEDQDGSGRFLTLAARALALASIGELARARDAAIEAIDGGERTGNRGAVVLGRHALGMVCYSQGDIAGGNVMARDSIDDIEDEFDRQPLYWRLADKAMFFLDVDEFERADAELARLGALAERTRAAPVAYMHHVWLARRHFYAGDWDDAIAQGEAGLAFAEENGVTWGWMALRPDLARIALHRDELDVAHRILPTASEIDERGANQAGYWALMTRALLHHARDEFAEAFEFAQHADAAAANLLLWYPTFAVDFVRLALAADCRDEARACVRRLESMANRFSFPSARGSILQARGMLDGDVDLLRESAAVHRQGPRPLLVAGAAEDAGAALLPSKEGAAFLRESLAIYHRLGATRDVARIMACLRAAGVRVGVRGRRDRPATGWESLTPTELRVCGFVAEGLSNPDIAQRMFISRYTVQTHLQHIFAKLDISSRVELAAMAIRRG